jgi:RES domain-containing protein
MRVFRVEREKYLKTILTGTGASLAAGNRWNGLHTKLIYTSESRALAMLEVAVHLDLSEDLPSDRYYVEIDIPDELTILEVDIDDLPDDWNAKPPTLSTQRIGDDFVADIEAAILKVPSSIVPDEFNYLVNPGHPDAKKIKVIHKTKMIFDARIKSA